MHHPIDGSCGRHRISEDLVPFAEDQIAGDQDGAPFIAFGEQGEQHLHLLAVLLHIPQVIEDEGVEAIESLQLGGETEIAFGGQ